MVFFAEARNALNSNEPFIIFEHFDTFFSVIKNAQQLQMSILSRSVHTLFRASEKMVQNLDAYFKQETMDRQKEFLNLIKMVMYLLVNAVRAVDGFVKQHSPQPIATGRKNKKNVDEQYSHFTSYENLRYLVLVQVHNVMQLPIETLWNMSIVDEDFIK